METIFVLSLCALAFLSGVLSMFFWDERDETEHETGSVLQ